MATPTTTTAGSGFPPGFPPPIAKSGAVEVLEKLTGELPHYASELTTYDPSFARQQVQAMSTSERVRFEARKTAGAFESAGRSAVRAVGEKLEKLSSTDLSNMFSVSAMDKRSEEGRSFVRRQVAKITGREIVNEEQTQVAQGYTPRNYVLDATTPFARGIYNKLSSMKQTVNPTDGRIKTVAKKAFNANIKYKQAVMVQGEKAAKFSGKAFYVITRAALAVATLGLSEFTDIGRGASEIASFAVAAAVRGVVSTVFAALGLLPEVLAAVGIGAGLYFAGVGIGLGVGAGIAAIAAASLLVKVLAGIGVSTGGLFLLNNLAFLVYAIYNEMHKKELNDKIDRLPAQVVAALRDRKERMTRLGVDEATRSPVMTRAEGREVIANVEGPVVFGEFQGADPQGAATAAAAAFAAGGDDDLYATTSSSSSEAETDDDGSGRDTPASGGTPPNALDGAPGVVYAETHASALRSGYTAQGADELASAIALATLGLRAGEQQADLIDLG